MAANLDLIIKAHDQASAPLKNIGEATHGVSTKMLALAGAAGAAFGAFAGAKVFSGAIGAAQQLGSQVSKLSRETGMAAEESSRLLFAFQRYGLSGDDASRSLGILAKKLQGVTDIETGAVEGKGAAQMLKDMGIAATDATGKLQPMQSLIPQIADKFKAMPDGIEKTGLAMQLFGRSGKDMLPVLNQGSAGLAALGKTADKLGLTLSKDNLQKIKDYSKEQKLMKLAISGLKLEIGLALMPVLTKFAEWMVAIQPIVRGVLHDGIEKLQEGFRAFFGGLRDGESDLEGWRGTLQQLGFVLREDVIPAIQNIGSFLKDELLPPMKDVVQKFMDFVGQKALIAATLTVVALGFTAWAVAAGIAAVATIGATWPVLALIAAVALLVGGLVVLDEKTGIVSAAFNWMSTQAGILWDWLGPKLKEAVENMVQLWNTNLLPAIQGVGNWMIQHLWPVLKDVGQWLIDHPVLVGGAVAAILLLVAPWTAVLVAMVAVAAYWDTIKIKALIAIHEIIAALNVYIRAWNSVMDTKFLGKNLGPHINEVGNVTVWSGESGTMTGGQSPHGGGQDLDRTTGRLTVNFNSTISTASPAEMQRAAIQLKSLLRGSL